jgi:hypothetical protein
MITDRDLAEQYARRHGVAPRRGDETAAQFRERVARALHAAGEPISAQEVLFNDRMTHDSFAGGPLDRGHGDAVITEIAELTQAALDRAQQPTRPKRSGWGEFAALLRRKTPSTRPDFDPGQIPPRSVGSLRKRSRHSPTDHDQEA